MKKTWNAAAARCADEIFGDFELTPPGPAGLNHVRQVLDEYISHQFPKFQIQDAARGSSNNSLFVDAYMWRRIGTIALAAGYSDLVFTGQPDLVQNELVDTLVRKQRDYGPENIRRFGNTGLMVRCHDKVARLENLILQGTKPENESLHDNFLDLIGYSTIGIMWNTSQFLLPLE